MSEGAAGYDRDSFERILCRIEPAGDLAPAGVETIRAHEERLLARAVTAWQQ